MVTFDLSNILSILSSFSSSALLVWAAVSRLIGVRQSASCSCHSLGHSNLLAPLSHCIEPPLVNDSMNLDRDSKSPQQHCPQTGGSSVSSKIEIPLQARLLFEFASDSDNCDNAILRFSVTVNRCLSICYHFG